MQIVLFKLNLKNKTMKKYIVTVWYRFMIGEEQEKDFNTFEVYADNEKQAVRRAIDKQKKGIVFKTEIIN